MSQDRSTARLRSRATLREVASAAGVHPATASRALNPRTRRLVNDRTAERVLHAAVELGYRPNPVARGLKTNRTYTIGVVVPDLRNPLFPPIARAVEERLEPAGYTSFIANTDGDPDRERAAFAALASRSVDGYIIATARLRHPLLRELAREEEPVVLVNRVTHEHDFPAVVGDDRDGMRQAVRHLVELGHRRIAHLAGPLELSTGMERREGFLEALEEAGIQADPDLIPAARRYSEREGARLTRELLASGRTFTAVCAGNDLMAIGCLDALREAGLRAPDDVSVIGFNDMEWIDRLSPPLTTVHIPHQRIGAEAADMLLERLADPTLPVRRAVMPCTLVVRRSTAPPPVA